MTEQIHFNDLTNYTHQISPFFMDGVKNVGWINLAEKFPTGGVPSAVLQKLKLAAGGAGEFQPLVEPVRESPTCQICGAVDLLDADGKLLPNAELWIPSKGCVYASPIGVLHLIELHNYCPPAEYIAAIEALDLNMPFVADNLYREKLMESGWFNRAR